MMTNNSAKLLPLPRPVFTLKTRNRSLLITREGAGFILLIFAVGMGAIYSGSNLLYLILAMCLSFLVVSGILSELVLNKISVRTVLPSTVYAEDPFSIPISIANGKKYFSSYCLRITLTPNKATRLEGNTGVYIFHLPPGTNVEKTMMVKAAKRGLLRFKGIQVSTCFPFNFFCKIKNFPVRDEAVVFPAIRPVKLPSPALPSPQGQGGVRSQGEEIVALREYCEGDPVSAVHWKTSAKTGNLRVKEFHAGGEQSFTLFLNLHDSSTNRQVADSVLEKRVSEAASLTYHLIRRGNEVSLKTEDRVQFPFGKSEPHLENILRFLALAGWKEKEE